jgi:hypothetical protein
MPNNIEGKPARLSKLEAYWEERYCKVEFHEQDEGSWCVEIQGWYAAHELAEIAKALRAVNKAGRL